MAYELTYVRDSTGQFYHVSGYTGTPVDVEIPTSYQGDLVKGIGINAFKNCSTLKTIKLTNVLSIIRRNAFEDCTSLEEIELIAVNTVGDYAFDGCTALKTVKFSGEALNIGAYAFNYCSSLEEVFMAQGPTDVPPLLGEYAFAYTSPNLKIYVPINLVNAYKTATNWNTYAQYIVPSESILYQDFQNYTDALKDYLTPQFNAKITNPTGGTAGQVLKKTASGVEWGEAGGGSTLYDHYIYLSFSGSHPPSGLVQFSFHIINTSNTPLNTFEGLRTYLYNNGKERTYPYNSIYGDNTWGLITASSSVGNNIVVTKFGTYEVIIDNPPDENWSVSDTVTEY